MDATAACIVHEELAYSDPAFCLSYLAHSQLFVNNLARNGTEEQMARLLPPTCSGEMIGGMGMSEPHAGTDVLGMTTKAEKQADGSYVLTGAKMWITNGAVSDTELGDVFLVYARTAGPEVKPSKATFIDLRTWLRPPSQPIIQVPRKSLSPAGVSTVAVTPSASCAMLFTRCAFRIS